MFYLFFVAINSTIMVEETDIRSMELLYGDSYLYNENYKYLKPNTGGTKYFDNPAERTIYLIDIEHTGEKTKIEGQKDVFLNSDMINKIAVCLVVCFFIFLVIISFLLILYVKISIKNFASFQFTS